MRFSTNLKKVLYVAFFAAFGHILSVFIIPFVGKKFGASYASDIALADSTVLLLVSILGFGLTLTVTRDIAGNDNWRGILNDAFNARVTASLIVVLISICLYLLGVLSLIPFICCLASPVIAANMDFALYGRGMPERAAILSFVRLSLPLFLFIAVSIYISMPAWVYIVFLMSFMLISSNFVFKSLHFKPEFSPKASALSAYVLAGTIGISAFLVVFQRYTALPFLGMSDEELYIVSTLLKGYLAFIAIRRLFIQTFYTRLLERKFYRNIERILLLLGVAIFLSIYAFSDLLSSYIFVETTLNESFYMVGFGLLILVSSLFSTADARLLLEKRDKYYTYSSVAAFSLWVFLILINKYVISLNILFILAASETLLILLYKYGLKK